MTHEHDAVVLVVRLDGTHYARHAAGSEGVGEFDRFGKAKSLVNDFSGLPGAEYGTGHYQVHIHVDGLHALH